MPDYSINILWEPVEIPGVQIPCCYVEGWRDCYAVACDGRLWSTCNRGSHRRDGIWRTIKSQSLPTGHRHFLFAENNRREHVYVHWLVLQAFRAEWPGGRIECRHLDGDPGNNWWWNLQWGTRQENVDDKEEHGNLLTCDTHPQAILTSALVAEARIRYAGGEGVRKISASMGIHHWTLHSAITGKSWFHLTDPPPIVPRRRQMSQETIRQIITMTRAGDSATIIARALEIPRARIYELHYRMNRYPERYA